MKIRSGFVSNSSSSSFILTGNFTDDDLKVTIDIGRMGTLVSTEDDVHKYFAEYYGYDLDDPGLEDELDGDSRYESALSAVRSGQKVLLGSVDNSISGVMWRLPKNIVSDVDN